MDVTSLPARGAAAPQKSSDQAEQLDQTQKQQLDQADQGNADTANSSKVQAEELIKHIKALTEDGLYSVRFESDDQTDTMVVKIVDQKTDKVLRQIPPKELLNVLKSLQDLRGNIVDTVG